MGYLAHGDFFQWRTFLLMCVYSLALQLIAACLILFLRRMFCFLALRNKMTEAALSAERALPMIVPDNSVK